MNTEELQAYHKHLTDVYDERSGNHDKSEWHRKAGDYVLDIGTGTGSLAFHAATLVNPSGKVIGVDLSQGMITQASAKLNQSGLKNLEFILGDMEHLSFPNNSFDKIYCASAFFCALDPLATLTHW